MWLGSEFLELTSELEIVTSPQASLAVAEPKALTDVFASELNVTLLGQLITGAVISLMVKVAFLVMKFPLSSVKVKVTVADPVAAHDPERVE